MRDAQTRSRLVLVKVICCQTASNSIRTSAMANRSFAARTSLRKRYSNFSRLDIQWRTCWRSFPRSRVRTGRAGLITRRPREDCRGHQEVRQSLAELLQRAGLFQMALSRNDRSPPQLTQRALMEFVARVVPFQLRHPPFAAVCRRRAIPPAAMPVPEAAVDEDGGFVFGQDDVRADEENLSTPHPDPLPGRGGEGMNGARTAQHAGEYP